MDREENDLKWGNKIASSTHCLHKCNSENLFGKPKTLPQRIVDHNPYYPQKNYSRKTNMNNTVLLGRGNLNVV